MRGLPFRATEEDIADVRMSHGLSGRIGDWFIYLLFSLTVLPTFASRKHPHRLRTGTGLGRSGCRIQHARRCTPGHGQSKLLFFPFVTLRPTFYRVSVLNVPYANLDRVFIIWYLVGSFLYLFFSYDNCRTSATCSTVTLSSSWIRLRDRQVTDTVEATTPNDFHQWIFFPPSSPTQTVNFPFCCNLREGLVEETRKWRGNIWSLTWLDRSSLIIFSHTISVTSLSRLPFNPSCTHSTTGLTVYFCLTEANN